METHHLFYLFYLYLLILISASQNVHTFLDTMFLMSLK